MPKSPLSPILLALGLVALGGAGILPAPAKTPYAAAQAGPPTPTHPVHHPHMGRIVGIADEVLRVRYPASEGAPLVSVPLTGAYLRAGFYPQNTLPFAKGQRVLVIGARSPHPTVMLLPEAVGTLSVSRGGWTVTGREGTFTIRFERPRLLGGARLQPNEAVEVFGTRHRSAIVASIVAAKPHIERAVVTGAAGGRLRLSGAGGKIWEFATDTVSPDLVRHLSRLGPGTPVLAVVAPDGAVLGVLPLRALSPGWPPTRAQDNPPKPEPNTAHHSFRVP